MAKRQLTASQAEAEARRIQALVDRQEARRRAWTDEQRQLARKNGDMRILVVFHLYYFELWPAVRAYLENLSDYRYDLVVTYPRGMGGESVLAQVAEFKPGVRLLDYSNAGFDVGPFVDVLQRVDLKDYDVVVKLQTKSCSRPLAYAYGQLFKFNDWFRCLYDGVLGAENVHRVMAALRSGDCALAAASNLIIADPYYRRWYVRQRCLELGVPYDDGYQYVAGTCFAARSEVLGPLKALGLTIASFELSRRGEFTLGHALERVVCFPAEGRMMGVAVEKDPYADEIDAFRTRYVRTVMAEDSRFWLNPDFQLESLGQLGVRSYEVSEMRLGDMDFGVSAECKYLRGEDGPLCAWCRSKWVPDELRLPIVLEDGNLVLEGVCRCRTLLESQGPDHRVRVIRVQANASEVRRCSRTECVRDVMARIRREFPLRKLQPTNERLWKDDTVLKTMFFDGELEDGRRCFVKYVPCILKSVETEWTHGRRFHELLPENAVEPLHCHVADDGSAVIAYEYLSGQMLGEVLCKNKVTPEQARRLAGEMRDMAAALQKMGISHRDVHLGNLMLADDGHLKLIDFQFAVALDARRETPFVIENWRLVLVGLGMRMALGRGLWNDRHSFAACIGELPDFPGKEDVRAEVLAGAEAVTCVPKLPFVLKAKLFRKYLSLCQRNFFRRLRKKKEIHPDLAEFCRHACFGKGRLGRIG